MSQFMSQFKNRVSLCNLVCVLLLLVIVAAQLLIPCWTVENKGVTEAVSVGEYVWFVKDYRSLTNDFKDVFGKDFKVDVVAYPHLYMLVVAGFALVFCLKNHSDKFPSLLALALGIMNVYYYLTNPLLAPTSFSWLFVVLGAIMIVIALLSVCGDIPKKLAAMKAEKAQKAA